MDEYSLWKKINRKCGIMVFIPRPSFRRPFAFGRNLKIDSIVVDLIFREKKILRIKFYSFFLSLSRSEK